MKNGAKMKKKVLSFNSYREDDDRNTELKESFLNRKDGMIMQNLGEIKCFRKHELASKKSST